MNQNDKTAALNFAQIAWDGYETLFGNSGCKNQMNFVWGTRPDCDPVPPLAIDEKLILEGRNDEDLGETSPGFVHPLGDVFLYPDTIASHAAEHRTLSSGQALKLDVAARVWLEIAVAHEVAHAWSYYAGPNCGLDSNATYHFRQGSGHLREAVAQCMVHKLFITSHALSVHLGIFGNYCTNSQPTSVYNCSIQFSQFLLACRVDVRSLCYGKESDHNPVWDKLRSLNLI